MSSELLPFSWGSTFEQEQLLQIEALIAIAGKARECRSLSDRRQTNQLWPVSDGSIFNSRAESIRLDWK
jgi:hypothetical protein